MTTSTGEDMFVIIGEETSQSTGRDYSFISSTLYSKFLAKDIKNLIVYYYKDKNYFQKVQRKIVKKFLKVADALDIRVDSKLILKRLEK